jgi:transcriptional regulator with XRE-family HTH domain
MKADERKGKTRRRKVVKRHPRKIVVTKEDMLDSPRLARLATRLIQLREASGLTHPVFAESLGISRSTLANLRRRQANPTIHSLAQISEKAGISLYELLEDAPLGRRKNLSGEEMTESFGKVVGRLREANGQTKVRFADSIQVAWPHVYRIIKGRSNPTLLVAEHIAKRLGLTLWQLLGVESIPDSKSR